MRRPKVPGIVLSALLAAAPIAAAPVAAQSPVDLSTARQLHGESRLAATLDFSAGTVRVRPADVATLYRMRLRYDRDRSAAVARYSPGDGQLRLGARSLGSAGLQVASRDSEGQSADVALSPKVDLALTATLGATESDVELGGLRLHELTLAAGASRTVVRFSRSNAVRCSRAEFRTGAAEFAVYGLGNSRCAEIRYDGGVGKSTLDFSGQWTADTRADVTMAVGELTLRLPRTIGVRLKLDRFLTSAETKGLVRRGAAWVSPNYDRAARHLDIDLSTSLGGVRLEWLD